MVVQTWMNEKTRSCWPGVREIASRANLDPSTVRVHLRGLERLGVIVTTRRKTSRTSNLTNVYFFPLLNEDFQRLKSPAGYGENPRVIQIPEIKEQTTTARETRAEHKPREWTPDRETYKPKVGRFRMTHAEMWRLKCAAQASIGTYTGAKTEISDAEIEATKRKMAEDEARRKAEKQQADAERRAYELEEAKRYREEQARWLNERGRR